MMVQNYVEQKQVESDNSHAELDETEDNENQSANEEPYIEEKVLKKTWLIIPLKKIRSKKKQKIRWIMRLNPYL